MTSRRTHPRLRRWSALTAVATVSAGVVVAFGGAQALALSGVFPTVECTSYNAPTREVTAVFGYRNTNPNTVQIPVGAVNYFDPFSPDQGQPTVYFSGVFPEAFTVTFSVSDSPDITWNLLGESITVTAGSGPGICSVNAHNSTAPSLSGPARAGGTLTADPGAWTGEPAPQLSVQWMQVAAGGDVAVPGATQWSLPLDDAMVGQQYYAHVTATVLPGAPAEYSTSADSPPSDVVAPRLAPSDSPAITGTPVVGQTLGVDAGAWPDGATLSYDWQRCAATCASTGATGTTYDLTDADRGATVRAVVTGRLGVLTASATTAQTAIVRTAAGTPPPGMSASSLTFGTVTMGAAKIKRLVLTNTGADPLDVTGFVKTGAATSDYTVTTTCAAALDPGASCVFTLRFVPTAAGSRDASLAIYDSTSAQPRTITLSGTGRAPVTLTPATSSLYVGNTPPGTTISADVAITDDGPGDWTLRRATVAGADAAAFTTSWVGCHTGHGYPAGTTCTLRVTFTSPGPGSHQAVVTAPSGVPGSAATITVSGSSTLTG